MGIRCLTSFVNEQRDLWRTRELRDCSLVIDGARMVFWSYHKSGGEQAYGGDYHLFAEYLRNLFNDFRQSKIQCYVIFDGGHKELNLKKKLDDLQLKQVAAAASARLGNRSNMYETVFPVLLRDVFTEVLNELKIPHSTCQAEAEDTIVALAKRLDCTILSEDSYFFLREPTYVPLESLSFDDKKKVHGKEFKQENLLNKYQVRKDVLPIFMMLLHNYYFEDGYFNRFFSGNKIDKHVRRRIPAVLNWLGKQTYDSALRNIFEFLSIPQQVKCRNILELCNQSLFGIDKNSMAVKVFTEGKPTVDENDPDWFEKGILAGNISKHYIDVYLKKIYCISPQVENFEKEDSLITSLKILKYGLDLLTNFTDVQLEYYGREERRVKKFVVTSAYSVKKPDDIVTAPFRSGWEDLPDYFGHFLREVLPGLPTDVIDALPADCRLFMIALVWLKIYAELDREPYCLLLSYLKLAVLPNGSEDLEEPEPQNGGLDIEDLFLDKAQITSEDRASADKTLKKHIDDTKESSRFDQKILHGFAQFQNCLLHLNCLNKLCGAPYEPTRCHRVFSGSLVYSVFQWSHGGCEGEAAGNFFLEALESSGTVAKFYRGLCTVFERSIDGVISARTE